MKTLENFTFMNGGNTKILANSARYVIYIYILSGVNKGL